MPALEEVPVGPVPHAGSTPADAPAAAPNQGVSAAAASDGPLTETFAEGPPGQWVIPEAGQWASVPSGMVDLDDPSEPPLTEYPVDVQMHPADTNWGGYAPMMAPWAMGMV